MRTFYEEWQPALNSAAVAAELPLISGSMVANNEILKSKFLTSSWGGVRKLPYAFTEQGFSDSDIFWVCDFDVCSVSFNDADL